MRVRKGLAICQENAETVVHGSRKRASLEVDSSSKRPQIGGTLVASEASDLIGEEEAKSNLLGFFKTLLKITRERDAHATKPAA
jgi:hypothetical protein